ncbi:hypothetical protein [Streptomyces sp. NPDC002588]|uniref:hypothetical protein n=1 Tax=Streptomyces sp. NPDC002588 TaxID=3154419 RepID=UPI003321DA8A
MRFGSSAAALAALLVAGVMTGASVSATGSGLGVRTEGVADTTGTVPRAPWDPAAGQDPVVRPAR